MGKISELKAQIYVGLLDGGLMVSLDRMVSLSSVRGYKKVQVDILVEFPKGIPLCVIYVGPKKERKMIKYRMIGLKVFYFHSFSVEEYQKFREEFFNWYLDETVQGSKTLRK